MTERWAIWQWTVAGGSLLGLLGGAPGWAAAQLGCCELNSPLGRACANTDSLACQPPSEFFPFFTCDGENGQCFEDNNPLRALDRKSTEPGFALLDGQVILNVAAGTTVYRRIGACNDTGQTLNYHTVYTDEGPDPEFANVNFALANGACTATQALETVALTTVKKISKWCAAVDPLTAEQCPPPRLTDGGIGTIAGLPGVFSNVAVSFLVVPSAGAPTLGAVALSALALLLAALGMWRVRRR